MVSIFSDIDGTLLATNRLDVMSAPHELVKYGMNNPDEGVFWDTIMDSYALSIMCNRARDEEGLFFAHNSGRVLTSIVPAYEKEQPEHLKHNMGMPILPAADAIISGVGSEIHLPETDAHGTKYIIMRKWQNRLAAEYNSATKQTILQIAHKHGDITSQEEEKNTAFKTSFYVAPDKSVEDRTRLTTSFRKALEREIDGLTITISHLNDPRGAFVDVTPASSGKDKAISFLVEEFDLAAESIIVAGDTLNDLPMFEIAARLGGRGIVPANGTELAQFIRNNPDFDPARFHVSDQHICATAVLEGLIRFGVFSEFELSYTRFNVEAKRFNVNPLDMGLNYPAA